MDDESEFGGPINNDFSMSLAEAAAQKRLQAENAQAAANATYLYNKRYGVQGQPKIPGLSDLVSQFRSAFSPSSGGSGGTGAFGSLQTSSWRNPDGSLKREVDPRGMTSKQYRAHSAMLAEQNAAANNDYKNKVLALQGLNALAGMQNQSLNYGLHQQTAQEAKRTRYENMLKDYATAFGRMPALPGSTSPASATSSQLTHTGLNSPIFETTQDGIRSFGDGVQGSMPGAAIVKGNANLPAVKPPPAATAAATTAPQKNDISGADFAGSMGTTSFDPNSAVSRFAKQATGKLGIVPEKYRNQDSERAW